jgi:creatinine amidohydrolase
MTDDSPFDGMAEAFGEYYRGRGDEVLYPITEPKTLREMSWKEVEEALEETDTVLVTMGSIENHGPHLPLGADTLKAPVYGKKIKEQLAEDDIEMVVGPTIPFGITPHHMSFPGTINIGSETYINLVEDVCESMIEAGFEKLILLNCHGGNTHEIAVAARHISHDNDDVDVYFLKVPTNLEIQKYDENDYWKSDRPRHEFHGGETETARQLYAYKKLVMMDRAEEGWATDDAEFWADEVGAYNRDYGTITKEEYEEIWPLGHGGDPFVADDESAERLFDLTVDHVCEYVREYVVDEE